jgi:hypothetical protein
MVRYSPATVRGFSPISDAAHHRLAAGAQIGFHVRDLENPFGAPPFQAFLGIRQHFKDPFRRCLDRDFLNDRIHRFAST